MIKLTFCLRRKPHLTHEEFCDYWLNNHGKLAQRLSPHIRMVRYVQNHRRDMSINKTFQDERGAPEPFDGVAEAWWNSWEVLDKIMNDPEAQKAFREAVEDEMNFIDLERSPIWLGEEHAIIEDGKPVPY